MRCGTEALAGSVDARERLARGFGRIPGLRRIETGIAVSAGRAFLAEVMQQPHAPAAGALAEAEQRIELGEGHAPELLAALGLLEHAAQVHEIAQAVGHPCIRRLAVAPGAAGLLVIRFDALRQVALRDEAHVGLVDAHAEGDRGDIDLALLALEALLVARCALPVHPAW
jgi:hypothetical protein